MTAFGELAQQAPIVDPGIYDVIVEKAEVVKNADGTLKMTENGKHQVDVMFRIDGDTTLNRRYTISFGKNKQNGQYAAFASFIAAVTGIPMGDPRQRNITESDLMGRRARIVTVVTDEGYVNIESVAPPPKAKPQPVDDAEIPF